MKIVKVPMPQVSVSTASPVLRTSQVRVAHQAPLAPKEANAATRDFD